MKIKLLLIIFLNISLYNTGITFSQNLVMNSSFEENIKLPSKINDFQYIKFWKRVKGSASYFHENGGDNPPNEVFKVPLNSYGFQKPHSGKAYASIMVINHNKTYSVICGMLKEPLIKNHKYYARVYVSLADNFDLTTSNLWFAFSDSIFPGKVYNSFYINTDKQIINKPDVFFEKKDCWEMFSGTFTAKGGEKFIALGSISTVPILKGTADKNHRVVFFIDDVLLIDITDKLYIEPGKPLVLKNIFFDTGKYELLPASFPELQKLANYLKENPDKKIEISGHTDNTGSYDLNMKLSDRRAKAVKNYLIKKGIDKYRIKHKGYGSTKPVDTNKTLQGRQNNRRVEVKIIKN